MRELLLIYYWELFVAAEIVSIVSLLLFGVGRYLFDYSRRSLVFLWIFLVLLLLEAGLALYVYLETGEISTFLIVVIVFLLYACTFGIVDFIKLDRWMRMKIGELRRVELLSGKDYEILDRNKNPKYVAKKYRRTSMIHLVCFVIGQFVLWSMGTDTMQDMTGYLADFSWMESGEVENSPYPNEALYSIGMIWGIVFVVDFIYSWSYTLFPNS